MDISTVAAFNGIQDCGGIMPDFELWTLLRPVRGLMVGSTYARATIESALCAV